MIWQLDLMILTLVVICALVTINIKDLRIAIVSVTHRLKI